MVWGRGKNSSSRSSQMFYMFFSSGKARQRKRESERCETCALRCSLCGHEASSRQRDSAVLVSLMTAPEPDNDQEPASFFAGVHLLAESPRKEVFFYFLIVIFWVVFFFRSCGPERLAGLLVGIYFPPPEMPSNVKATAKWQKLEDVYEENVFFFFL